MSKLQSTVDGQTIQFLPLPKIFSTLSSDLPSGRVDLKNGEFAYWRLHRNLLELKNKKKNMKDIIGRLVSAFKSVVQSKDFLNHYGLAKAPDVASDNDLSVLFRNLLNLNTNRVTYTSTYFGNAKPRVETIQVALGNLVFLNANKGLEKEVDTKGLKGTLWLDHKKPEAFYKFTVLSPVVNLQDFISADRLAQEVITKIKQNLPDLAGAVKIEFNKGQFNNYLDRGLEQLADKHNGAKNTKQGKKRGESSALTHVDEAAFIKTHTVVAGESLSKIAHQAYGNGKLWRGIFKANADKIENPDLIYPDQVFVIPDRATAQRLTDEVLAEEAAKVAPVETNVAEPLSAERLENFDRVFVEIEEAKDMELTAFLESFDPKKYAENSYAMVKDNGELVKLINRDGSWKPAGECLNETTVAAIESTQAGAADDERFALKA